MLVVRHSYPVETNCSNKRLVHTMWQMNRAALLGNSRSFTSQLWWWDIGWLLKTSGDQLF